ncbi:MAG: 3-phosphoshikimate 1-carboxyvinyltransferase [Lachnospiraceae bacterium]|nr:3-phosphoshikimate 1-carboxyvinyltransferase [Lachnospiraceae bacterium]
MNSYITRTRGEVTVPGDKSISHRSIMLGSIAKGTTRIKGFLEGEDCLSTIDCFKKLGIKIEKSGDMISVFGQGLHGLKAPSNLLYTGNSGTTTRLISGILSAQDFSCTIDGDASIRKRPMSRIITPLSLMGADIKSEYNNNCAPLHITGSKLHGIEYTLPVASAQVKSSILLAGLYAEGKTTVTEPAISRNHSELMLAAYGAKIQNSGLTTTIETTDELYSSDIEIPGDISSAAYFITAALITQNDGILIKNVGVNPTRDGILKVYEAMGGKITRLNERIIAGEPVADLLVSTSELHATTVEGDIIPTLIDEIPVIVVAAAMAEGTTIIKDAKELKVKESDRIAVMTENMKACGIDITATDDGFIINGHSDNIFKEATVDSHLDHRIAMSFAIANLCCKGNITIKSKECVDISYPGFYRDLESIVIE